MDNKRRVKEEPKRERRAKPDNRDKDLRKLRRSELLELLVVQSEEIDRLRTQLARMQDTLRTRELYIRESGSLAEAAVKISGVMKAAEDAAQIYLNSIKRMEADKRAEQDLNRQS